jgi:group I intron endonuclease
MRNDVERLPRSSGIYALVCQENGKIYVGSSINLRGRGWSHLGQLRKGKHGNPHLQSAWNKYGEDSFNIKILELCDAEKLLEREQFWMDHFEVIEKGFNLVPRAGGSVRGQKQPKELVALRAASQQGKKHNYKPEAMEALRERMRKRVLTPEERTRNGKRLMAARLAHPEEYKAALSEGRREYNFDPQHLQEWTNKELMDHYGCSKSPIRMARRRLGISKPTGRPKRPSTTEESNAPHSA